MKFFRHKCEFLWSHGMICACTYCYHILQMPLCWADSAWYPLPKKLPSKAEWHILKCICDLFCLNFGCDAIMTKGVVETDFLYHHYLIIGSYLVVGCSRRPHRLKLRVGSERPWHKESYDMRDSVWDGLWRPGGAFSQISLGCVMSHHHIDGHCTFLFKFWRENAKWSACQQLVTEKDSL